ncbi:AT-rich interactive domain-containing protein 4B isoform X4 [Thalassophryne amazonica]|uniref:AT-rich interactive domain-containing protein 4B isoform X4 n=1 Tax=Thalassophryne amazonica TaxID=390379 RepID=UPI001470B264|nr:AT-rich interactive domain-containing protein 4B isoform X4 [Thalassophryne amazonica]
MKTLEEPPYLTVGTDVSAKYRGAFCEAKIKTAKRLVKAKVTFKPDLSTAEVHDENIKGPLKVGAVVEVKNQDGIYQEATINKLTDASIYTVVFDDGDEKTLRRSSLCLKGARHFAESETLDRLPLTNPEHFGTPVIGKKGNRGRRSNPIQEEELSSSSSEEEESSQRQNEDLFGKVVCVEGVSTGDKKKATWYPALVISPDSHEDLTVKKDSIFVRSFKDGKFYIVLRKDVRKVNIDCPPKADAGIKPALDAALDFQQQLAVPSSWKTEVKEESSSSEDEDEDEEEEEEDDDDEDDEEDPLKGSESSSAVYLGAERMKQEPDDEQESKANSGDDSSQEGEEGEEFECYPPGMKVQVRYGRGRSLKTYEATVKEADVEGGEVLYLVHYCGWNVRYDEWIKADKIVGPANKNVPKIKHRKKIKNKAERERDKLERLGDREVLGPPSNIVQSPRSKCGLSEDVFSKIDEGEDKGTRQSPIKSIEITSILNGLQASEISTDESEDEVGPHNEDDVPGCCGSFTKSPPEPSQISEHWESISPPQGSRPSPVSGKNQDFVSPESLDVGKCRSHLELEGEASTRKRKSEGTPEKIPKGLSKAKTRNTRSAEWLPGAPPRKLEERGADLAEERTVSSSSSSDDEGKPLTEPQVEGSEQTHLKTKGSSSKKYNGMKEKNKTGRKAVFWEIAEKRTKMSVDAEERPAVRSKGQKDVWSSIQAQWPKKTLKDLFSDSDTEAANSPPPPVTSVLEEPNVEQDAEPEDETSEEQMENDKMQEFPSSGSNSVLNTPPTTPESPSGGGSTIEDSSQLHTCSPPSIAPALASEPAAAILPPGPIQEEAAGGRSETDSSTVEVESLGAELRDLPQDDEEDSPSKVFDASLSCSSNCSLELSSSSQQESEQKSNVSVSQKRPKESQTGGASKKHKPNRKSLGVPPKKNRKTANSSDSEDQSVIEGTAKSIATKNNTSDVKATASPKCPGRSPPSSHKYHKQGDADHIQHREHHGRSPRVYKWSFQMSDLEKMTSLERISFLQEKLQDIRNHYLSLKSEVASIDRRRKRMKKKERESTAAACSSSSSSSSPSSSSLTAAVMLTLADPPVSSSSSSSSQNSGVSVECR